ncbi:MauE/DoxX family redox-associated membrane protein [Microbacterium sp. HMWF026]|uniref:MauE/DoxX family redox-associated membrane protein n=1 Tax=Microbacterium sp. HMWF026 TaxID=2056861 RepID=UPI0015E80D9F|nr:MauE/DoxX family redox-associated membrane protein [Microbacterium sp. HMWF026]
MSLLLLCLIAPATSLLLVSGIAKIVALDDAPRVLSALRLPLRHPRLTVTAVSLCEVALALGLAVTDGQARVAAAVAILLLLAGFTAVTARAVGHGSTDDCGCLGRFSSTPLSPALVRRNAVLSAAALLLAVVCAIASASSDPSAVVLAGAHPLPALIATAVSAALVSAGFATARAGRRGGMPAPDIASSRPALIREDGLVIDVATEAARGRGQLLVFAQPHCDRCLRVIDLLDQHHDALAPWLDVRIVYPVGAGRDWNAPARENDGPRTPAALDLNGALAGALDVGAERPVGVLMATNGHPVLPYANGENDIRGLVSALVRSRG